jgi:hypothetical protein
MANVKISELPVATSVDVVDTVPLVQGGTTKQATQAALLTTTGNVTAAKLVPTGGTATGNGMYLPATNTLAWSTNGAEGMRLDSSGNLGLGVTPSAWGTAAQNASQVLLAALSHSGAGNTASRLTHNAYFDGTNWRYIGSSIGATRYEMTGANAGSTHSWSVSAGGTAGNAISFTQAMTLTSGGKLLVNTTDNGYPSFFLVQQATSADECASFWNSATSGDNNIIKFYTDAGQGRGSITYNRSGGLTAYNTTSDYRAKDILGPVANPGATIDALKVYIGKMKGATVERPMLVAHEAQEVAPYAVTGQKDAVNEDGTPKYQQMDASTLVPLLIAEIQSLRARVAALEA